MCRAWYERIQTLHCQLLSRPTHRRCLAHRGILIMVTIQIRTITTRQKLIYQLFCVIFGYKLVKSFNTASPMNIDIFDCVFLLIFLLMLSKAHNNFSVFSYTIYILVSNYYPKGQKMQKLDLYKIKKPPNGRLMLQAKAPVCLWLKHCLFEGKTPFWRVMLLSPRPVVSFANLRYPMASSTSSQF